jgi:hypothetical protein
VTAEETRDAVNKVLHRGMGAPGTAGPCETACTHVIVGNWTALGIANVFARHALVEPEPHHHCPCGCGAHMGCFINDPLGYDGSPDA